MLRITSLAAAAALLSYTGLALAQQPASSPAYPNRYQTQPTTGAPTVPERQTVSPSSQTMTPSRDTMGPGRQKTALNADQFGSEGDARAHCSGDTVVWVNTRSNAYHFAGSKDYGNTKHGAFMCRADADRAGKFHAAKNELKKQQGAATQRSSTSRFSGSSTNRY
jgi:hypothetical protein